MARACPQETVAGAVVPVSHDVPDFTRERTCTPKSANQPNLGQQIVPEGPHHKNSFLVMSQGHRKSSTRQRSLAFPGGHTYPLTLTTLQVLSRSPISTIQNALLFMILFLFPTSPAPTLTLWIIPFSQTGIAGMEILQE